VSDLGGRDISRFAVIYRVYDFAQNSWKTSARIVEARSEQKAQEILTEKALEEGFGEKTLRVVGSFEIGSNADYFRLDRGSNGGIDIRGINIEETITQIIELMDQQGCNSISRKVARDTTIANCQKNCYALTGKLFVNKLLINKFSLIDIFD
jgi:hypothetical protein